MTGRRRRHVPRSYVPWLFLIPATAATLVLFLIPNMSALYFSLTDWNGLSAPEFVGLDNFILLAQDAGTRDALVHTVLLTAVFVILVNITGLALAVGTHRGLKSRNLLRALFFAPMVISPLAVAYVWQFLLQTTGPVNELLASIGLADLQQSWLGNPDIALWAVLAPLVWQFSGFAMVIYLAGLQNIPDELYEAGSVDGAGAGQLFRSITIPQLSSSFTIVISLTTILGLRIFDQILGLTGGGPADSTQTLATELYSQAFSYSRFGYGTAIAVVLSVLIILVAVVQFSILRGREARYN